MTNYEQLKKKIYEALPRLMDDVVGQNYEYGIISYRAVDFYENGLFLMNFNAGIKFFEFSEIANSFNKLGIEPTLSDCLSYVKKSKYVDGVNMMTDIQWANHLIKLVENWNLSQPLLKDQSEELIDYLLVL